MRKILFTQFWDLNSILLLSEVLWQRIFLHSEMKNVMWSHFKDRNSVIPELLLFQIFLIMAAFKQ